MKWPTLRRLDDIRELRIESKGWHRWYAWHPVVLDRSVAAFESWCWLATVERARSDGKYYYRSTES